MLSRSFHQLKQKYLTPAKCHIALTKCGSVPGSQFHFLRAFTERSCTTDELFEFTSGRWLFNDRSQREARRTHFNVEAFCRTACAATGASAVTRISKISESINRILLVKFDNGFEAIARFPMQLAGPAHYTIASEVATMDFLRRRIGIPVPRVIAWNSDASAHEVEAEFILMEKVSGRPLRDVTGESLLSTPEKTLLIEELTKIQKKILDVRFAGYGAIYFSRDISKERRLPQFLAPDISSHPMDSEFCLGPMTRRDFWFAERTSMTIDRGPWTTPQQYMLAVANREYQWIKEFHTPHFMENAFGRLPQESNGSEFLRNLDYYKKIIPFLVPAKEPLSASVLWHPDLHDRNIMVEEKEPDNEGNRQFNILSILDWENTWAGPTFLQLDVPEFLQWPDAVTPILDVKLPADFKERSESEQKEIKAEYYRMIIHRVYQLAGPWPRDLCLFHGLKELVALESVVREPWICGLSLLRHCLLEVCKRWDCYRPDATDLPINIDNEYLQHHERAYNTFVRLAQIQTQLCKEWSIGELGYVEGKDPGHFLKIAQELAREKIRFIAGGRNEEECRQRELAWPFQDTVDAGHNPRAAAIGLLEL